MLNRKASNVLFWGMLVGIAAIVTIVRLAMLGNMETKIEDVTADSRRTQLLIDIVDEKVSKYRNAQEDTLYELYQRVPNLYDDDLLVYFTVAQLELSFSELGFGISEDSIIQREIFIREELTFASNSIYSQVQDDFNIVAVEVQFNTYDLDQVETFVDRMYDSEQIFIISEISYTSPGEGEPTRVEITFLTFYQK